jgi:hypothetical protein
MLLYKMLWENFGINPLAAEEIDAQWLYTMLMAVSQSNKVQNDRMNQQRAKHG